MQQTTEHSFWGKKTIDYTHNQAEGTQLTHICTEAPYNFHVYKIDTDLLEWQQDRLYPIE